MKMLPNLKVILAMAEEHSSNKWRNLHGQLGMICEEAEYITFSHNVKCFTIPANPGPYLTTVDPDAALR
jgi:hypothetical protein